MLPRYPLTKPTDRSIQALVYQAVRGVTKSSIDLFYLAGSR